MDLPKPPGQAASARNKTSRQSTAEALPGDGANQQPLQAAGSAEATGGRSERKARRREGAPWAHRRAAHHTQQDSKGERRV